MNVAAGINSDDVSMTRFDRQMPGEQHSLVHHTAPSYRKRCSNCASSCASDRVRSIALRSFYLAGSLGVMIAGICVAEKFSTSDTWTSAGIVVGGVLAGVVGFVSTAYAVGCLVKVVFDFEC